MRFESYALEVPTGAGTSGGARWSEDLTDKWVQVSGYVDGTWKVQASDDGTTWIDTGVTFNGNGWNAVATTARWLRLWCTVLSTSAPSVLLAARNARTE